MRLDPRVYRLKSRYRHIYSGLGAFFALVGLGMAAWALFAGDDGGGAGWILAIGAASLLMGAITMIHARRFRYELSADAIERHGLFGVKRLWLADVGGRRLIRLDHGPPMIRLLSNSPRSRQLDLHAQLETDAHLQEWLASLPDHDHRERQESLDAYLQQDDGVSSEEKHARLTRAYLVSRILGGLSLVLVLWAFFYPRPYDLLVAAMILVPLITLIIAAGGGAAYTLNPRSDNDVRAQLLVPLFLPGAGLALRAMLDLQLFDWPDVVWATLGATAGFMVLAWVLFDGLRKERTSLLILAGLMSMYGYGVVAHGNRLLDRSDPDVFHVEVLDKRVSTGKSTSYYLELAPWGPRTESAEAEVDRDFHDRVRPGGTVCVYLWPGALKIRWFEVWECPV